MNGWKQPFVLRMWLWRIWRDYCKFFRCILNAIDGDARLWRFAGRGWELRCYWWYGRRLWCGSGPRRLYKMYRSMPPIPQSVWDCAEELKKDMQDIFALNDPLYGVSEKYLK